MEKLGIVIIGFKNTEGIKRLLESLDYVDFEEDRNITLIFSIDYSGDRAVEKIANEYEWCYGEKHVITHSENLGLHKHILSCGNYMEEYDLSAVAVCEDDIYVSPEMYKYMKRAVNFYKDDSRIAGISLYKHEFNLYAQHPFDEYCDGGDTFFVQYAMSWGQIWMREQWKSFRKWYDAEQWKNMDKRRIPANVQRWKDSWLKYHIMYCIDQNLYFVYPRVALATNFTDVGTHNKSVITSLQVKLCMIKKSDWQFMRLNQTRAVYDAFFESLTLSDKFNLENFEVDLYGVKEYSNHTRYVLTRKALPNKVIKSWGLSLRPIEANVYMDIPGEDIFLYDLAVAEKRQGSLRRMTRYWEYDLKGVNVLCLENILFCISRLWGVLKIKIGRVKKGLRRKNE